MSEGLKRVEYSISNKNIKLKNNDLLIIRNYGENSRGNGLMVSERKRKKILVIQRVRELHNCSAKSSKRLSYNTKTRYKMPTKSKRKIRSIVNSRSSIYDALSNRRNKYYTTKILPIINLSNATTPYFENTNSKTCFNNHTSIRLSCRSSLIQRQVQRKAKVNTENNSSREEVKQIVNMGTGIQFNVDNKEKQIYQHKSLLLPIRAYKKHKKVNSVTQTSIRLPKSEHLISETVKSYIEPIQKTRLRLTGASVQRKIELSKSNKVYMNKGLFEIDRTYYG